MLKRFVNLFNTLFLLSFALGLVLFASNTSFGAEVTLAWDPNDPVPDGYHIYQRTEGQPYDYSQPSWTGSGTTGTVYNLALDTTYCFVVRAYAGSQESADSAEISYVAPATENSSAEIWIEAEDGDLQWPMEIADDGSANAGGYIWVPSGSGNFFSPSENAGYAEYRFDVPETGNYVIWGRQISSINNDSFFVSVDGQAAMIWHTKLSEDAAWTWDVVSWRSPSDPRDFDNPRRFHLAAGAHTLKISQREDGTMLDRILVTNQTDGIAPESDDLIDAMAFGDVQINHSWTRVTFEKPFADPVVVAGPISLNGGQPAVVRIRNVDATGFEIRLQEWEYLDGSHANETVSYLVIEQGTYALGDGTRIEAANVETDAAASFKPVAFSEPFSVSPIVMTAVASFNDATAVTGRLRGITVDGFNYRMQEQEANTQDHGIETLAYIAWEPSSGVVGETTYVVDKTADAVTNNTCGMIFNDPLTAVPIFLADMQTTNGGDPANVRCRNICAVSVDVIIDEEQSLDTEVSHYAEVVGYMAFSH